MEEIRRAARRDHANVRIIEIERVWTDDRRKVWSSSSGNPSPGGSDDAFHVPA